MVAPLLAAGAAVGRTVITNASKKIVRKTTGVKKRYKQHIRAVHRGHARELLRERKESIAHETALANHPLNIPQIGIKSKKGVLKTARAMTASFTIASLVLPFYFLILLFGLISLVGYGIEVKAGNFLWGVFSGAIPGEVFFGAGFIMTAVMGIVSMFAAAAIYLAYGIFWFKGHGSAYFFLCTGMYLVPLPFVSMIPWLAIWMFVVISAQRKA